MRNGERRSPVPEWVGKAFRPRARASYRSILLALARTKPARYRSGAGVSGHSAMRGSSKALKDYLGARAIGHANVPLYSNNVVETTTVWR